MSYDERLAVRIRTILRERGPFTERRMFGGVCFMVKRRMCCGIVENKFFARIGTKRYEQALELAHASAMTFTGRPMKRMVYVDDAGLATKAALSKWIDRGIASLTEDPPKAKRARARVA